MIEKSLDLDPLQIRGYDIQALVLVSLGRFADAEASYRKADELEPGEWSAVVGWTLVLQGRFEEAKKAIDSETDEAWRLLMLAYWYQGQGQEAEAAAVAQRLRHSSRARYRRTTWQSYMRILATTIVPSRG